MSVNKDPAALRVAIGAYGTVGAAVAQRLDEGIEGLTLTGVSARDRPRAERRVCALRRPVPVLSLAELADVADVVVECAPAAVFAEVAEPAVRAGRIFVPITVGALLSHWHLVELATQHGARIIVPSGALLGLDAVKAAAQGRIGHAHTYVPDTLCHAPLVTVLFDDCLVLYCLPVVSERARDQTLGGILCTGRTARALDTAVDDGGHGATGHCHRLVRIRCLAAVAGYQSG
ncbi:MAG: hypothetical protein OES46_12780 [Gammaproteobacteria bacterium]|nr:hypothetical protein [Gammaproteobacteria bacterium]